jgi:NTP pyrophosphatase (non-canonical NTP hydrolase)
MIMNEKQNEVLRITQEECAEVVQSISKIFRFGIDEVYEGQSNKQRLASELGDLQCMINLIKQFGIITEDEIYKAELNKRNRLGMWSNIFDKDEIVQ